MPTAGSAERVWPKAAKSSSSPQRPVRRPSSQVRRTVMRCSSVSLRATTCQWSVTGVPARTSSRATVQPTAVRTLMARSGSSAAGRRPATASVWSVDSSPRTAPSPLGPASQQLGRPADAVGQRAGLRVDQAGRRALPRRARRRVRRGQAPADLVGQPAVQLVQAGADPRRPLVGPLLLPAVRRRRTRPDRGRRPGPAGRARRCVRTGLRRGSRGPGRQPARRPLGPDGGRHVALGPQQEQPEGVLARHLPARARAAPGRAGAVHHDLVGLGRGAAVEAPDADVVTPEVDHVVGTARPPRRVRHRRVRRQGEHVRGGPPRRRAGDGRWPVSSGRSTGGTTSRVATGCDTGGAPARPCRLTAARRSVRPCRASHGDGHRLRGAPVA